MPRPVLEAMVAHLELEAEIGGYEAADGAHGRDRDSYPAVAALLGCRPENVAFAVTRPTPTPGRSRRCRSSRGDVILTTRDDYISNQIAVLLAAPAARCRGRARAERARGRRRRRRDRPAHARAAAAARRGHARPDELRARPAGRGDRPRLPRARPALPRRRLPVGRPAAARRRGDRLRLPLRDRAASSCAARAAPASSTSRDRALEAGYEPLFLDMRGADWTGPTATSRSRRRHGSRTGSSRTRRVLGTGGGRSLRARARHRVRSRTARSAWRSSCASASRRPGPARARPRPAPLRDRHGRDPGLGR